MSHSALIVSAVAGLVVAGCSTTRHGELPDVPVAENWSHPVKGDAGTSTTWWERFEIPELNRIVQTALASNANIAVLVQRVELARAEARVDTSPSNPILNADSSVRAGSERTRETDFETVSLMPWSAGGVASWELDWLGKWRHRRAAARQTINASQADLAAGRLVLITEVVSTWFQLQQTLNEAKLLTESLDRQNDILGIYSDRSQGGLVEAAVLESQEAETADLERELLRAQTQHKLISRTLDRLLGRTAGPFEYTSHAGLTKVATPALPSILPVEALRRRPDLAAAEARLRAAWSIEHAAKLDLYPSLSLRLSGVTMTGSLSDPFRSWIAQVGPRVQIPLWDPDRRATAQANSARALLAAAEYRAAAILAVEEIESALIRHHQSSKQLDLAMKAAHHANNIVARTSDRLDAGLVSQLDLLIDQRRALNAQITVSRLKARYQINFATLHRALGA